MKNDYLKRSKKQEIKFVIDKRLIKIKYKSKFITKSIKLNSSGLIFLW